MRLREKHGGLTVNAIAGSHVVFFGLGLIASKRKGLRGFAFKRSDAVTGETVWLRGMKTFEATEPFPAAGETFSTRDHPLQGFQWADYSVRPGRDYTYTVVALYGKPDALKERGAVELAVTTETDTGPTHSAFFNRGSAATQEYARRFQNQKPDKAGPGAYEWLSRGLLEALVAFLERAGQGWEVHGAVYEFQWPAALAAVRAAHQRGAKVHILFDDIAGSTGPSKKNREAIAKAKIKSLCKGRANGKLMHNKFFVLTRNGRPTALWTGSTNLTQNGIFGHSNVGQIVEDEAVARAYREYWDRLADDPPVKAPYRAVNTSATPCPPVPWSPGTCAVFSPRGGSSNLDSLDWYATIARAAQRGLFMTFAFGMHESFKDIYRTDDAVLRMALLEKAGNNPNTLEQDKKDIQAIRNRPNVVLALGNRIATNAFDRWLAELDRVSPSVHVYWIHTKYMIVDPLGDDPIVVSGSANFSKASTTDNDENMLVIRGDKRIADIFFGEYLRLYTHYAFRESVAWYMERKEKGLIKPGEEWRPQYLDPTDAWMKPYFDPSDRSARHARRVYFSGPMAT
jgi:phosphatidylserine/phosphatidylglycerophosphate/cardiolipin synthase-like enzyme